MLCFQRDEMGDLRAYDEPEFLWSYKTAWDFDNLEAAQYVAEELNQVDGSVPDAYRAVDRGENVSPRYDVIRLPQVGDVVSRAFNGDYYPCGKIVKISPTYRRIETEDGTTFYRVRETGSWRANKTWWMVAGEHSRWNPSF